jgi:hypothetical protein
MPYGGADQTAAGNFGQLGGAFRGQTAQETADNKTLNQPHAAANLVQSPRAGLSQLEQGYSPEELAANTAAGQTQAYNAQAQAASNRGAFGISNPSLMQTRNELSQTDLGYGTLENSLGATAGGAGPNAGQAVNQAGQDSAIANAMSHGGGRVAGNLGAASAAMGTAQMQGANARQAQISGAQAGLGSAYAGSGGLALNANTIALQQAQQQAALEQAQSQQNQTQALALYGQGLGEQGSYLAAVNQGGAEGNAAHQLGLSQQAIQNQQNNAILGATLTGAGTVGGAIVGGPAGAAGGAALGHSLSSV